MVKNLSEIQLNYKNNPNLRKWAYIMVFARTVCFYIIGFILLLFLIPFGSGMEQIIRWWPIQVIIVNIIIAFALYKLTRIEKISFKTLYNFDRRKWKEDLIWSVKFLIPTFLLGGLGLYGGSFLIWGTMPPTIMYQSLPIVAAIISFIFMPLTNAYIETTTYFAYSLERLEIINGNPKLGIFLSSFFLAFQHIAFPLVFEWRFLLWRFISFLPVAFFLAWVYLKVRRMTIFVIGQYFMDLSLVIYVLIASI